MNAFNGDPKSLNGRVVNPERIRVVAPGSFCIKNKIVRTKLSLV